MAKVLHASYSGYFPICSNDAYDPTQDELENNLNVGLEKAMSWFWKVRSWNVNLSYTYTPFGESPINESINGIYPVHGISNEKDYVCKTGGELEFGSGDFSCAYGPAIGLGGRMYINGRYSPTNPAGGAASFISGAGNLPFVTGNVTFDGYSIPATVFNLSADYGGITGSITPASYWPYA